MSYPAVPGNACVAHPRGVQINTESVLHPTAKAANSTTRTTSRFMPRKASR